MKLVSPVFSKEMVTLARRKRFYALRAVVIGAPLVAIWLTAQAVGGGSGMVVRDLSAIGRSFFVVYTAVEWMFVLLMVPLLMSSVVASERKNDTLALLMATNLTPRSIVLDKALARAAFTLLLLLSGVPFLVVLTAFGGVDLAQVTAFFVLITASVFLCCGMGLIASTRAATAQRALFGTYLLLLRYVGLVLLLWVISIPVWGAMPFVIETLGFGGTAIGDVAPFIVPFALLPVGALSPDIPFALMVISCVGFPLCVFFRFRHAVRHCVERLPMVEDRTGLLYWLEMGELDTFFRRLNGIGAVSSWELPNRRASRSSLFDRDLRVPFVGQGAMTAVITLGVLLGTGCCMWGVNREFACGLTLLQNVLVTASILMLASSAFADDKEGRTLETLLSTPISRFALVMGRFLRVAKRMTVYVALPQAILLLGLLRVLLDGREAPMLMVWPFVQLALAVFLGTTIAIGLVFSAFCHRRESALGGTFLTLVLWYIGPYGLHLLLAGSGANPPWLGMLVLLSPLGWFGAVFEEHNVPWGGLLGIATAVGIVGFVLMTGLIRRFDAIVVKA